MPKTVTLSKIDCEIAARDYQVAKRRLQGLILTYPDDLSLRSRLAEIYDALAFPAMAGRYWYLETQKSHDMEVACRQFEKSCSNNPAQILQAIGYRGNFDELDFDYARQVLLRLQDGCETSSAFYPEFGQGGIVRWRLSRIHRRYSAKALVKMVLAGLLGAYLLALIKAYLVMAVVGIIYLPVLIARLIAVFGVDPGRVDSLFRIQAGPVDTWSKFVYRLIEAVIFLVIAVPLGGAVGLLLLALGVRF